MPWSRITVVALVAASGCSPPGRSAQEGSGAVPSPGASPSVPSAVPASPTPTAPHLSAARIQLFGVATLEQPLALTTRPGDPALYVAQKTGQVVAVRGGRAETILDLSAEVSQGTEQGLLGLAFSPDGRFLYVNLTDLVGDTRIVEYAMRGPGVA